MGTVFGSITVNNTKAQDIVAQLYLNGDQVADDMTVPAGKSAYWSIDPDAGYVVMVNGQQVGPIITLIDCNGDLSCITNQATVNY